MCTFVGLLICWCSEHIIYVHISRTGLSLHINTVHVRTSREIKHLEVLKRCCYIMASVCRVIVVTAPGVYRQPALPSRLLSSISEPIREYRYASLNDGDTF